MNKRCLAFFLPALFFIAATSGTNALAGEKGDAYAGSDTCVDCHDQASEEFEKSIHNNKLDPRSPVSKHGCESCHGPRAEHVKQKEDKSEIPEGKVKAEVDSQVCLDCHNKGKVVLWAGSQHESRDVNCSDCHNAHGSKEKLLTRNTQTEVCSECHKDVRAQTMRASHHPIREGKINCSDCHNPHGTVADKLIAANTVNEKCYECHAEKRGPFLWEHAPVTENCTECHTPHGSTHDKLLNARTPFLCQRCHSNARHPGTLYALDASKPNQNVFSGLANRGFYRNCLECHNSVHGTNHPSGKSLSR